ncbi:EAL domain-containing protein [Klebsiella pneumoniae subsp. pneumoniae]|nr:EAL domain-containing protein [Klebsiella pneumoniae subsp. pneumoniae]
MILEITESDVFNENTRSLEILSQLRELGIQISIDDFGTGYSSLSSFKLTSRSIKLKSTARLSSIFRS